MQACSTSTGSGTPATAPAVNLVGVLNTRLLHPQQVERRTCTKSLKGSDATIDMRTT
jgi:hypothetical protein